MFKFIILSLALVGCGAPNLRCGFEQATVAPRIEAPRARILIDAKFNNIDMILSAFDNWHDETNGDVNIAATISDVTEGTPWSVRLVPAHSLDRDSNSHTAAVFDPQLLQIKIAEDALHEVRAVMLHELGHMFGLGHSDNSKDVMWPLLSEVKLLPGISKNDVTAFKRIRGI
jgi:hypothetical protein